MVRAGLVNHPSQYLFSGYNEIINPPKRYNFIDAFMYKYDIIAYSNFIYLPK